MPHRPPILFRLSSFVRHLSPFVFCLWSFVFCLSSLALAAPPATAPTPFLLGADISALAAPRQGPRANASQPAPAQTYSDPANPALSGELPIMLAHHWNAFRLRVFVSPVRSAPNNSLENTIALARQIKASGATFLLDIHYSDTWADPQHQETPIAWRNLDTKQLAEKVHDYTLDVLHQLAAAGAAPDMVQVGNEITGGMLWPTGHVKVPPSTVKTDAGRIQPLPDPYDDAAQWSNLLAFLHAGTSAVREATKDGGGKPAKIVIHIDCGGDWPTTQWFFDHLTADHVDYDLIGQSFYPNYHGTLDELAANIANCTARYHKPFLIAETGYPQTGGDAITSRKYMSWPGTPEGQAKFLSDLISTAQKSHAAGVFYWAPEGRGRGNALWTPEGTPDPAMLLGDHLTP